MSDYYHNIEEDLSLGMVTGDRVLKHVQQQRNRIEELEAKIEVLRLIARAYRYNKEMGDKVCEELGVDLGRQTNE